MLRTPLVQAYAVRHSDGFDLIDASVAGQDDSILAALAGIAGSRPEDVTIADVLLTHAHDDHTGSASALADRTGARVLAPAADAPVIEGVAPAPPPELRDWEIPIYEQTLPQVPPAPPVSVDVRVGHGAPLVGDAGARLRAVAAKL